MIKTAVSMLLTLPFALVFSTNVAAQEDPPLLVIGEDTPPDIIQEEAPTAEEAMPNACMVRTVEGMEDHSLTRSDLNQARDAWNGSCGGGPITVRDCDPLVSNGGWICSGIIIGVNAPGGLREGETAGFAPSAESRNGDGSVPWQEQGGVITNPGEFVGGGDNPGTTIRFPGSSSAGKIGSGDLLALHYDNCPDPDDGHAMASATAMIATYGLNNVIVVNGTCGNSIRNLFDADSRRVADAVFPSHLDAAANWAGSVSAAAARWTSTLQSGNSIWVAEGGPSDFTADVLRRVDSNGNFNLKDITVVQHAHGPSSFNEGNTDGSNLAYVERVASYVTIANGNQTNATANLNNQSNFFVNAARASGYAAEWQAAFNYLPPTRKLDFSDTVELLYLVNDTTTKTVDQFATRYIIPARPTGTVIVDNPPVGTDPGTGPIGENNNGVIIIEAEDTNQTEGWDVRTAVAGFTGSSYIQWTGANRFFEREARPGNIYTFTLERGGNYQFRFRSRIMQGNNATEHNDTWVSFPSGRNIPGEEPLDGYTKAYMGPLNQWSWVTATVDGQGKPIRQFFSAGTHTVQLSGRSTGHAVDRIALYEYERVNFNAGAFDAMSPASRDTGSFSVATEEQRQVLDDQAVAMANSSADVSAVTVAPAAEVDPEVANMGQIPANVDEGQPRYLAPFVETQGFITTRISDFQTFETEEAIHSSSRRQVWSPEGKYMLVGGRIIDSDTKEIASPKSFPAESLWSNSDDAVIYSLGTDNVLTKYTVKAEEEEALFRLPHADGLCSIGNGEGNIARNGKLLTLTCLTGTDGTHRMYSVDLGEDDPLVATFDSLPNMLWASTSPSGIYILAEYGDEAGNQKRLQRYTVDFSRQALLSLEPNSGDFGFDEQGQELYAMVNGNNFSYIRLDDGQTVNLDAGFNPGFGTLSCQTTDRQTCFYSTYDTNQLGTITLPSVPRIGDTQTPVEATTEVDPWGNHFATSSDDSTQPNGVIAHQADKAVFVSDRGGRAVTASYLIERVSSDGSTQTVSFSSTAQDWVNTNIFNQLTNDN